MKILLVSATSFEITPVIDFLNSDFQKTSEFVFKKEGLEIQILITGVGMPLASYCLGKILSIQKFDFAINAGVAGAFSKENFDIGDVVNVIKERFADLGAEDADGSFIDIIELGLMSESFLKSKNGWLVNSNAGEFDFLKKASGISINKVHGCKESIEKIKKKFPEAEIESMEGAAFFLCCNMENLPFLELRSISNFVEPRDVESWNLPLAIENLNSVLTAILSTLSSE